MGRVYIGIIVAVLLIGSPMIVSSERDRVATFPGKNGNEDMFVVGEELVYNVRYGFISLGKITVTITGSFETGNERVYSAHADISSYSGVPFVSLHHIYSSDMTSGFYSLWFESLERNSDRWDVMRFSFDYDMMSVMIEEGPQELVEVTDTLDIDGYYQDGLSIFYFARGYIGNNDTITIPTLINKNIVTTDFNFNGDNEGRKFKVADYPVDVVELRGNANFSGIFGMTGAFRGWFTNDTAAIPLEARLRVLIGNVTVELIEWNRPGWTPPKYTSNN